MAVKWQPKITKARFKGVGFSAQQMVEIGDSLIGGSIKPRIMSGLNVYDQPSPPLNRDYARAKKRRTGVDIRNWRLTGHTLAALKVLQASNNRCTIGFISPQANMRAYFNNRRHRQFGLSPRDKQNLIAAFVRQGGGVVAEKVA